jgi:tetratricopeptide (TPR) repeat protein
MAKKTCFVVMGFGTKTDYTKPKTFNLDKTYKNIIKPAATAAGLECIRADEIVHSGNINVPMYEQLLHADVVVADVSTYNCNAFYELGVRHALRPYTTIIISEDGLTFPFDVGQIAIKKYHHMGEGIDFDEVERMRNELAEAMKTILEKAAADSPVYTFLKGLRPPTVAVEDAVTEAAAALQIGAQAGMPRSAPATAPAAVPDSGPTISILMEQAEGALDRNEFVVAKALFADLHNRVPNDINILHKLALATYKAKLPSELEALDEARRLLTGLDPTYSTDVETLGLLQAVHKRLWNLTNAREHLEQAIWASEKGFYLKNDYYNGINLAFLYNVRASLSDGADAITDFVLAQRTRRRVLDVCQGALDDDRNESTPKRLTDDQTYWVFATMAEAWSGLGDEQTSKNYLAQALALKPAPWMVETTQTQLERLRKVIADSPLNKTA